MVGVQLRLGHPPHPGKIFEKKLIITRPRRRGRFFLLRALFWRLLGLYLNPTLRLDLLAFPEVESPPPALPQGGDPPIRLLVTRDRRSREAAIAAA